MGPTLKHVRCKVLPCLFHSYLSMNSVGLRPTPGQVKDVYSFTLGGPNIDYDKILTSSEGFAKLFYSLPREQIYSSETSFGCRSTGWNVIFLHVLSRR